LTLHVIVNAVQGTGTANMAAARHALECCLATRGAVAPSEVLQIFDVTCQLAWEAAVAATMPGSCKSVLETGSTEPHQVALDAAAASEQIPIDNSSTAALATYKADACLHAASHILNFDNQLVDVYDKLGGWEVMSAATQMLYERWGCW
jgi:hypothetical protein